MSVVYCSQCGRIVLFSGKSFSPDNPAICHVCLSGGSSGLSPECEPGGGQWPDVTPDDVWDEMERLGHDVKKGY